jgi:hypothetical protein
MDAAPGNFIENGIDLQGLLFVPGQVRPLGLGSEWAVEEGRGWQEKRIDPEVSQQQDG